MWLCLQQLFLGSQLEGSLHPASYIWVLFSLPISSQYSVHASHMSGFEGCIPPWPHQFAPEHWTVNTSTLSMCQDSLCSFQVNNHLRMHQCFISLQSSSFIRVCKCFVDIMIWMHSEFFLIVSVSCFFIADGPIFTDLWCHAGKALTHLKLTHRHPPGPGSVLGTSDSALRSGPCTCSGWICLT